MVAFVLVLLVAIVKAMRFCVTGMGGRQDFVVGEDCSVVWGILSWWILI